MDEDDELDDLLGQLKQNNVMTNKVIKSKKSI